MERIHKLLELVLQTPKDCFLHHALGLEYVKINELEKAIDSFEKVIQLDEYYVGTYYHLAKTFEKLQKQDVAVEIYRKGIDIARKVNDMHAKNELQMALDDLVDD